MKNKSTIAVFDFDGTITNRDSLIDFIIFSNGYLKFLVGIFANSPFLILYKLGLYPNDKTKGKFFSFFFRGMNSQEFIDKSQKYSLEKLGRIIRPEALDRINWHKKQTHKVLVLSASAENWVRPWAKKEGLDVIGTKVEISNSKLTGNFATNNCFGQEKVRRLLERYPARDQYTIYAYGDSKGDRELLELADHAFYKMFGE
ncbi:HAD family hydrolase [Candidatus Dojkabacteria bacterium]|nr:HAD family hydrolase [Candidatus Dojkabacteria bacterium]